jgi:hypothetical protein
MAFVILLVFISISTPAFAEETEEAETEQTASDCASLEEDRPDRRYIAWPLVFSDETPEWSQFSFVPFYVARETVDGSEERSQFLWPMYMHRRSGQDVSTRIFPLYTYRRDVYAYSDGERYNMKYMLFPFVFGGDSTEDGRYFAFFPFGGEIKNFLGRDEISFALFPLYMRHSKGEMAQRNYLWPVLSFSQGGGYDGFRFWPFYGYMEREGQYRNEFIMWPIYGRQRFDFHREQSGERMMVLPFYAREDSRSKRYRAVLWPFFSHERNYARNFEERAMPWPFIVIARGDFHRTQIWPFYGYTRAGSEETRFFLWPIGRWRQYEKGSQNGETTSVSETSIMPFVFSRTEKNASGEVTKHKERIWPLWRLNREGDGSTRLRMLSLFWFADERGFERQYSHLWTIYEREQEPGGDSKVRALWGLFRRERCGSRSETRIPLLFSRVSDSANGASETKVLGGLIAGINEGGKRRLKLFHFGGADSVGKEETE